MVDPPGQSICPFLDQDLELLAGELHHSPGMAHMLATRKRNRLLVTAEQGPRLEHPGVAANRF